jgi:hypothetical protein
VQVILAVDVVTDRIGLEEHQLAVARRVILPACAPDCLGLRDVHDYHFVTFLLF